MQKNVMKDLSDYIMMNFIPYSPGNVLFNIERREVRCREFHNYATFA